MKSSELFRPDGNSPLMLNIGKARPKPAVLQGPSEPVVIGAPGVIYFGVVLRRRRTEALTTPIPRPEPALRSGLRPVATAATEVLEAIDPESGEILTLIRAPYIEVDTAHATSLGRDDADGS